MDNIITLIALLGIIYGFIYGIFIWIAKLQGIDNTKFVKEISIANLILIIIFIYMVFDDILLFQKLTNSAYDFWINIFNSEFKLSIDIYIKNFLSYTIVFGIIWLLISTYILSKAQDNNEKLKSKSMFLINGVFLITIIGLSLLGGSKFLLNENLKKLETLKNTNISDRTSIENNIIKGKEIEGVKDSDIGENGEGLIIDEKDGKYGFVDKNGNIIIDYIYDDINGGFSEGLASVKKDGKYGFIDKNGNIIIDFFYDYAWNFSEGLAGVMKKGKMGFIDKDGNVVIDFIYGDAGIFGNTGKFSEGLAAVQKNWKWGYIDKTGKIIINFIYDYNDNMNFSEGLASVKKDGKMYFIDKEGKVVITLNYDYNSHFSEGLALVSKNRKFGFIDKEGKVVIDLIFDSAGDFNKGSATVSKEGKYGSINKEGNIFRWY